MIELTYSKIIKKNAKLVQLAFKTSTMPQCVRALALDARIFTLMAFLGLNIASSWYSFNAGAALMEAFLAMRVFSLVNLIFLSRNGEYDCLKNSACFFFYLLVSF